MAILYSALADQVSLSAMAWGVVPNGEQTGLTHRLNATEQAGNHSEVRGKMILSDEVHFIFFQGYLNQYRCLQALNRGSEAMQAINECLKRTTNETLLGDLVNNALDIAVTLEGTTIQFQPILKVPQCTFFNT